MHTLAGKSSLPWCCIGDFNDLLSLIEKRCRVTHPNWLISRFKEAVANCGLVDLGLGGYQFTWERGRRTDNWVEDKLDRVMASSGWVAAFKDFWVRNLIMSSSNHSPIFLEPTFWIFIPKNHRFCGQCELIVEKTWKSDDRKSIQEKILLCA